MFFYCRVFSKISFCSSKKNQAQRKFLCWIYTARIPFVEGGIWAIWWWVVNFFFLKCKYYFSIKFVMKCWPFFLSYTLTLLSYAKIRLALRWNTYLDSQWMSHSFSKNMMLLWILNRQRDFPVINERNPYLMCFPNVVAIFECNKILACVVSPKMRKDEQREREGERSSNGEEEKHWCRIKE